MAKVTFTRNLYRFFPDLPKEELHVPARSVAELIDALDREYPRLNAYLRDEAGSVRKHVAIYVDNALVTDRLGLTDTLKPDSEVFVAQALSGG